MMKRLTLLLTLLWLPNVLINLGNLDNFFAWRHQLIIYTGFLTFSYMIIAVILAARLPWVEEKVKGLDKGYNLHKHLGIGAAIACFMHWLLAGSAKWLVEAGLLQAPNRPRPSAEGINWHMIAEVVGEKAFYILIIITIISLVHAISYKTFRFTHKIMGIAMLAGIFHAILLLDWDMASIPMNLAVFALAVYGAWCSWLSLSGKIGKRKKVEGSVTEVQQFSSNNQMMAIRFSIQLASEISYKNGQFAYLNFHDKEYPHPFSILNYDPQTRLIEFGVKDLGDYTNTMVNELKKGQKVTVEGGYGCFQTSDFAQQVWVGAGIGIVPFLSRLYALKGQNEGVEKVHLFYCVNTQTEAFFEDEISDVIKGLDMVELHVLVADKEQLLDANQIIKAAGDSEFDISFCGPEAFGIALQTGLEEHGVSKDLFHKELFKMR